MYLIISSQACHLNIFIFLSGLKSEKTTAEMAIHAAGEKYRVRDRLDPRGTRKLQISAGFFILASSIATLDGVD